MLSPKHKKKNKKKKKERKKGDLKMSSLPHHELLLLPFIQKKRSSVSLFDYLSHLVGYLHIIISFLSIHLPASFLTWLASMTETFREAQPLQLQSMLADQQPSVLWKMKIMDF